MITTAKALVLMIVLATNAYAQTSSPLWLRHANTNKDSGCSRDRFGVSVDASGNTFVTGTFQGVTTFEGTTLTPNGGSDIFLAKYDSAGDLLWIRQAGSASSNMCEQGISTATDNLGNCFVTGEFLDSASFDTTSLILRVLSIAILGFGNQKNLRIFLTFVLKSFGEILQLVGIFRYLTELFRVKIFLTI